MDENAPGMALGVEADARGRRQYRRQVVIVYLHKIIESLAYINRTLAADPRVKDITPGEMERHAQETTKALSMCVSYHFEDIETIQKMTNKAQEFFTGDYGEDIRLPHKHCWFDFEISNIPGVALAGVAAHEIDETALYLETYTRDIGFDIWKPSGINVYIGTGDVLENVLDQDRKKNLNGVEDIRLEKISENLWISGGYYKNSHGYEDFDQNFQEDKQELFSLLRCFNAALLLLSCKNITTETVPAPAKLNKKRVKSGKPPVRDHHVLRLVLPKKQGQKSGQQESSGGWTQKPSFCSGHFKIYTADAPLFGRLTGRYWWEPHVRGGVPAEKKQYIIIPRREK